jgi:hypothetical protein
MIYCGFDEEGKGHNIGGVGIVDIDRFSSHVRNVTIIQCYAL